MNGDPKRPGVPKGEADPTAPAVDETEGEHGAGKGDEQGIEPPPPPPDD